MAKISKYPDGGAIQATDQLVVARAGHNKSILGSNVGGGSGGSPSVCDGRLTLETGVPVSVTNQTAKVTLYFTPYVGDKIGLYDGVSAWSVITFVELSLSLAGYTASKNYDIFVYNNAGTATLESAVWTNDTTRATALVRQNGILVKSGATTRRYLGTIRITTVTGQCEDSLTKRFLWNYYNRTNKNLKQVDSTANWTYNVNAWRQANAAAANMIEFVIGVSESEVRASYTTLVEVTTAGGAISLGLDRTNAIDATFGNIYVGTGGNLSPTSIYAGYPSAGYHYLAALENAVSGTPRFWGQDYYLLSGTVRG